MARKKLPVRLRIEKTQNRRSDNSPQLPLGMPAPPVTLSSEEYSYYFEFAHQFDALKILTQVDSESVGNLARLAVLRDMFQDELDNGKLMYETTGRNGTQKKVNPAVAGLRQIINDMRLAMAEFGLSPSSRTKIKSEEGEQTTMFPNMAKVAH